MKKIKLFRLSIIITVFALVLSACSIAEGEAPVKEEDTDPYENSSVELIEVEDVHGNLSVPFKPKKVIALDNRTFETLADWDIKLLAVPKAVMPADSPYVLDESVKDIGNHREPNLELMAALDPELVIVGQRFANYYEDIKELLPDAAVIDLTFDVSSENSRVGESLSKGLEDSTLTLGKIFDKNLEAEQLVEDFRKAIDDVKDVYNSEESIMSVVVSGGNIGFSAPITGRVWGPMYDIFQWTPALEVDDTSSDHMGDDISVEAIAQSNPDWIFVLDRDAAISSLTDKVPAQDVIDNSPALKNTLAIKNSQVLYAPNDTYTNESIQTYLELFTKVKDAFSK